VSLNTVTVSIFKGNPFPSRNQSEERGCYEFYWSHFRLTATDGTTFSLFVQAPSKSCHAAKGSFPTFTAVPLPLDSYTMDDYSPSKTTNASSP